VSLNVQARALRLPPWPQRLLRIALPPSFLALAVMAAAAEEAPKLFGLDHAGLLEAVGPPAISPDGTMVTHTLDGYRIWVTPLDGGESRQLPWKGGSVSQLQWAADGRSVEFLADDARGICQLWSCPVAGPRATAVTAEYSNVKEYAWSPDRRRLAMVLEGPPRQLKSPEKSVVYVGSPVDVAFDGADIRSALLPLLDLSGIGYSIDGDVEGVVTARFIGMPWDEVFERILESHGLGYVLDGAFVRIGRLSTLDAEKSRREPRPPIAITSHYFKKEGTGYVGDRADRLVVRFLDTGQQVAIAGSPPDPSGLAWSPDGRVLAFSGARTPHRRTSNLQSNDVFLVEPGKEPAHVVASSDGDDDQPGFTSDGRHIVYRTEAEPAEWPVVTHRIAMVRTEGGKGRYVSGKLDREIDQVRVGSGCAWFLMDDRGGVRFVRLDLTSGHLDDITPPGLQVEGFDIGPLGKVAFLASSVDRPPAIFLRDGPRTMPIAEPNSQVVHGLRLPAAERIRVRGPGGVEIEGFILPPSNSPPGSGRPPGIVLLHGGPYCQHTTSFEPFWHLLSGAGYAVIAPNPRGSSGYGRSFGQGSWGERDSDDVMAFVDEVVRRGLVDPDRLGIGGWSYGGWLTNQLITRTHRFRAAVTGASVSNQLADYGVSDTTFLTEVEFGLPWESLDKQVRMSPLFRVNRVRTPTLVLCGEKDLRTPLNQSEQWYQALSRVGVKAELVVYPGLGHSLDRQAWLDVWRRSLAWFERFLKEPPSGPTVGARTSNGNGG